MAELLHNLYLLGLDAAPLLALGLFLAAMMRAWLPTHFLEKQLGQPGPGSVIKAALFGAPMPLCSCGVLPVALSLRRAGASKGSTVSFLVATPETGVDSIALSYGLLGPVMAVTRPVVAIINAIVAGLLTGWADAPRQGETTATKSCCASKASAENDARRPTLRQGLHFTFGRLYEDMLPWLTVGLVFAALVQTFVPEQWLAQWGQGPLAMVIMIWIGIPMYICASASTPIAAGLLLAGVSPGTVLVFMMAGPASNIAAVGLVYRELGRRAVTAYLASVAAVSIAAGLSLDALIETFGWTIRASGGHQHSLLPEWLAASALLGLILLAIKPLRQRGLSYLASS